MTRIRLFTLLAVAVTLLGVAAPSPAARPTPPGPTDPAPTGPDDVTVVAIVDTGLTPYHWDFSATRMPQHSDRDRRNDLPLTTAPHTWLPGFPDPGSFASYSPLTLTLSDTVPTYIETLYSQDLDEWGKVRTSDLPDVHYYWLPGTKIVGMIDFVGSQVYAPPGAHGAHTAAVSTGTIHGSCPECLLVFVNYGGANLEAAVEWAMDQPWIDVVSNSYGFSLVSRDRLYSGSNTDLQREASERGQTVFYSAGNGQDGTFLLPNTTYFSSQEGPDWIVTVGAVTPSGYDFSGSGKPADLAAPGRSYPSIGGPMTDSEGVFGGTSNATPVVAGMYAHALSWARLRLSGASRVQTGGIVAAGDPVACGTAEPACALADGTLTAAELRTRLLHGAIPGSPGIEVAGLEVDLYNHEFMLASQGHGTYFVALADAARRATELRRLIGPLDGSSAPPSRPSGERDWFVADSYCRQHLWGAWSGGYYVEGSTERPAPDPVNWPMRTAIAESCGWLFPPV